MFFSACAKNGKAWCLTWGGLGIVLASLLSVFYFHEKLSAPAICGIALIVIGTAMCNFFGAGH
ncbi:MAG: hypothetical protein KH703_08605 [Campylobacter gracilis]|nr:hypothetical protein [Campylobacter gracilis]